MVLPYSIIKIGINNRHQVIILLKL